MTKSINTHDLYNELVAVGLTDKQADIVVRKFATKDEVEAIENRVATKADIVELRKDLDILGARIEAKISESNYNMLRWMVGLLITSIVVPHLLKSII